MMREQFIWVEKYRPHSIEDCILPKDLKATFMGFVGQKQIPNLLFSGGAGIGKTSAAKALCEEIGHEYIFINASQERGIDVLRTKILQFASSVSFNNDGKVVILDEGDNLTFDAQQALKGMIEEFAINCRFIFTANFKNRIIPPIQSRCVVFDFTVPKEERAGLAVTLMKRTVGILKQEGITYNKEDVAKIIQRFLPDYRKILNELQRHAVSGELKIETSISLRDDSFQELVGFLHDKNWGAMRKWVAHNIDNDPNQIIRKVFDESNTCVIDSDIPQLILILADYQSKIPLVVDQELNLTAMFTEIMANIAFK